MGVSRRTLYKYGMIDLRRALFFCIRASLGRTNAQHLGRWASEQDRGAHLCLDLLVVVVEDLGEAEVPQLNDFLAIHEEHVIRFDVAVKYLLLLVQVVHAKTQL